MELKMSKSSLHEQELSASNIHDQLDQLLDYVTNAAGKEQIHIAEKEILNHVLQIGLASLQKFVKESGTGYEADNPPVSDNKKKSLRYKTNRSSPYLSIFGEILIERAGYHDKDKGSYYYPIDELLNLPEAKYSYLLTDWLLLRSTDSDYREAVNVFNKFFNLDLHHSIGQNLAEGVSRTVQSYYTQADPQTQEAEGSHLVLSADGKGVPIRKSDRPGDLKKPETPKARRAKGEKPGIKKEATVTATYSFIPGERTGQDIVTALLHEYKNNGDDGQHDDESKQAVRVALNKHYRASLISKDNAIERAVEQLIKRNPDGNKPIVVLIDGDPGLEKAVDRVLTNNNLKKCVDVKILDIVHVCEYIWEAGTAIYGEKNPKRREWVREKLLDILDGKVGYVIGALKQIRRKNKFSQSKLKTLKKVIRYFTNHKHMMRYDEYLTKGYPIGTGVVESACGSLVKNRMERNGMRWSIVGAQAMLQLRAVARNKDWEQFMDFFINEQKQLLYPDNYTRKMAA